MSWTDEQKPHPYIKYTTVSVRRTLLKSSFKNLIGFFLSRHPGWCLLPGRPTQICPHASLGSMMFGRNLKTSPHLSLLPDCDDGCTEVCGRCTERRTKTQHIDVAWPLIKMCHQNMKKCTSRSRLTFSDMFVPQFRVGEASVHGVTAVSPALLCPTCPIWSQW